MLFHSSIILTFWLPAFTPPTIHKWLFFSTFSWCLHIFALVLLQQHQQKYLLHSSLTKMHQYLEVIHENSNIFISNSHFQRLCQTYLALKVETFKTTDVWSASASLQLKLELLFHHRFPHLASNIQFFLFLCCCLSHWSTPSFLLTTRCAVRGCIDPQGFSHLCADMASCRFLVHNLSSRWATLTLLSTEMSSPQSPPFLGCCCFRCVGVFFGDNNTDSHACYNQTAQISHSNHTAHIDAVIC